MRIEKRHQSNRAQTAIIEAAIAMRKYKGNRYAVEFLLRCDVEAMVIGRFFSGRMRNGGGPFDYLQPAITASSSYSCGGPEDRSRDIATVAN